MGISREQALDCFASNDLIGVGMEADAVRRQLHPEGVVSYLIDRTIDLSELSLANAGEGTEFQGIHEMVRETIDRGGSGVHLRAGTHSDVRIESLEWLLSSIKQRFPQIWLHGLNASEILPLVTSAGITLRDGIMRLRDAGLDSISGDDAFIFDDALRAGMAPGQCSRQDWIRVHRTAHELGMQTTAAMRFGMGETAEQRVQHLAIVRELQEDTGGFSAFIPLTVQGGRGFEEPTSVEYLKTLAIVRMYLDNIDNVQSSWATQGLKVSQMGLRFGGNDVGSVMLQASAAKVAGASNRTTEEELRRLIRDAGFKPVQRDTLYRTMFLN